MESKLLKVKLKSGARQKFLELVELIKNQPNDSFSEMAQKGYYWDSFFLDQENYLYMVLKSADFSSIMMDDSMLIKTAFRQNYDEFRARYWIDDTYQDIEELFCFNDAINFLGHEVSS